MKKKKGFTLVELLAVIIILAVILVISVPKVNNIIKADKEKSFFLTAKSILRNLEYTNLESNSMAKITLASLNIDNLSSSEYDLDNSYIYTIDGDTFIDLKGKGKMAGLYACKIGNGTITSNVNSTSCGNLYSVTNLVTNGSFEDGTTGWSPSGGVSSSNIKAKFGNYSARNYHSGQWGAMYTQSSYYINAIVAHKYYFSSWLYTTARDTTNNYKMYNTVSVYYDNASHWQFTGMQTNLNIWERISGIITVSNVSSPKINLAISDYNGTTATQDGYSDGIFVIDLTETFGAGYEPSKAWCDKYLNYFDGTKIMYLNLSVN